MNNQKLTVKQKHVQYTQRWNEKNQEYFTKQNRLRSKKTYLENAIPKMELKTIQYKLRINLMNKQIAENSKCKQQTKQEPKKEHVQLKKTPKPKESTICHICGIPYSSKEGLLRHNARRHTTNSLEEKSQNA